MEVKVNNNVVLNTVKRSRLQKVRFINIVRLMLNLDEYLVPDNNLYANRLKPLENKLKTGISLSLSLDIWSNSVRELKNVFPNDIVTILLTDLDNDNIVSEFKFLVVNRSENFDNVGLKLKLTYQYFQKTVGEVYEQLHQQSVNT